MSKFISLTFFLFWVNYIFACPPALVGHSIFVLPDQGLITQNAIFMLQERFFEEAIISKLDTKWSAYLKSGNLEIPMQVLKINTDSDEYTQALLKPTQPLIEGETYTLQIKNLTHTDSDSAEETVIERFNNKNIYWTVHDKSDKEAPNWRKKPVFLGNEIHDYPRIDNKYVNFFLCLKDTDMFFVQAKLIEIETQEQIEFYTIPHQNYLRIGGFSNEHKFHFKKDKNYQISFSLMDASGNKNDTSTNPIFFNFKENIDLHEINKAICQCPKIEQTKEPDNELIYTISIVGLILMGILMYLFVKSNKTPYC